MRSEGSHGHDRALSATPGENDNTMSRLSQIPPVKDILAADRLTKISDRFRNPNPSRFQNIGEGGAAQM
jgi:hypothetical protein